MFVSPNQIPIFKSSDKVKLFMKYLNRWVDFCPSDGISLNDENSICSFVTFNFKGYYYIIIKPNLRVNYQNGLSEGWKKEYNIFQVFKFKLSDLANHVNQYNKLTSIFKVTKLEFNDETLFQLIPTDAIYSVRVDSQKEFNKHFKKVMKNLVK
jgi:hypothetical protein